MFAAASVMDKSTKMASKIKMLLDMLKLRAVPLIVLKGGLGSSISHHTIGILLAT